MSGIMQTERIKWELRQSMGEELIASSVYQVRALTAQDAGDTKTAALYRHIAEEEDGHYGELALRLSELKTGMNVPLGSLGGEITSNPYV